jgi:hypothetical protein
MHIRFVFTCLFLSVQFATAQSPFVDACLGEWEGTLRIMQAGETVDSVAVSFTVAETSEANVWIWRMAFQSAEQPVVKDYRLKREDPASNHYLIDEGDGLILHGYCFGLKLHCVFETGGRLFTSSYERVADRLVFEVTAGKALDNTHPGVGTFAVSTVQRAVLRRKD